MRPLSGRRAATALGAAALALPFGATAANAATGGRTVLPGSTPGWAHPAAAVSTVSAPAKVSFSVVLPLREAAGAEASVAAASTPGDPRYGKYLSPAQFNTRFAPTDAAVARVRTFLAGAGLTVTSVADGNRWVSATGTVSAVNAAFGTTLKTYTWAGKRLMAPSTALSVPTSFAGDISGVSGLAQTPARPGALRPGGTTGSTSPVPNRPPTNTAPTNTAPTNTAATNTAATNTAPQEGHPRMRPSTDHPPTPRPRTPRRAPRTGTSTGRRCPRRTGGPRSPRTFAGTRPGSCAAPTASPARWPAA